ncbi:MAG TPA: hypothetical protein PK907_11795 [Candidatus Sabulitectum sp.]|nr:hypothetical protein [Candidatus Sabulitectum sp.]HPF33687.1 hypothetical protein [Candidatus Sabulitectum sp.]
MKERLQSVIMMFSSVAGVAAIAAIVSYVLRNDSGHTGFSPYLALGIFIPASLAGLVQLLFFRAPGSARRWAVVALFTGIAGICLLVYLDLSNTLLEYGVWCRRGMP